MKIVKFLGGVGNQLFQYAFFCALQQEFGRVKADISEFRSYALHNGYELDRVFGIHLPMATRFEIKLFDQQDHRWFWRKLRRVLGYRNAYYEEPVLFAYDKTIFNDRRNRYFWGYWQHIEYINRVEELLRKELVFPAFTEEKNLALAGALATKNTVSVHVRRGDYTDNWLLGGICDEDYYRQALAYMRQQITNPRFLFFSNDIPWCRDTFAGEDTVFVDWNTGSESFRDMQLMSLCRHHIIANSSFSWWGAWLNTYPGKIVYSPNRWVTMEGINLSGIILPDFVTHSANANEFPCSE